jgi:hypothetical protein
MGVPNYPSPYGPQSPRPKSSGRGGGQVLASAPQQQGQQHYSPYGMGAGGMNGAGQREMPFKVMIPGPPPSQQQQQQQQQAQQERRGSR